MGLIILYKISLCLNVGFIGFREKLIMIFVYLLLDYLLGM